MASSNDIPLLTEVKKRNMKTCVLFFFFLAQLEGPLSPTFDKIMGINDDKGQLPIWSDRTASSDSLEMNQKISRRTEEFRIPLTMCTSVEPVLKSSQCPSRCQVAIKLGF